MLNLLNSEKSTFHWWSPRRIPRPELPYVKSGGTTNAALVEPCVHCRVFELAGAHAGWAAAPPTTRSDIRHVARDGRREGQAAAVVHDALGLPPAEQSVHERSRSAEEPLSSSEWQFSTEAHAHEMRHVKARRSCVVREVAADAWSRLRRRAAGPRIRNEVPQAAGGPLLELRLERVIFARPCLAVNAHVAESLIRPASSECCRHLPAED